MYSETDWIALLLLSALVMIVIKNLPRAKDRNQDKQDKIVVIREKQKLK